jgi:hypothetical protein
MGEVPIDLQFYRSRLDRESNKKDGGPSTAAVLLISGQGNHSEKNHAQQAKDQKLFELAMAGSAVAFA